MDEEDGAAKGVGERKDARENPPFCSFIFLFFILFFLYTIITILTQNKLQYLVSEV